MTEPERREYLNMLGTHIKELIPPDGVFVLAVIGSGETPHSENYLSSGKRDNMPHFLRNLADQMEQNERRIN